jgi:hypothetical protein
VKTSGTDQPSQRFCHVAAVHNEAMFVFGDYDASDRLNNFVRFDFAVYNLSFEVPSSTLVSEFRAMVDDEMLSDVTFLVEGTSVYAHKLMLIFPLFLGEMINDGIKNVNGANRTTVTKNIFANSGIPLNGSSTHCFRKCHGAGKDRVVLYLSCRQKPGEAQSDRDYCIVTNKWQYFTDCKVIPENLHELANYCASNSSSTSCNNNNFVGSVSTIY